MRATSSFIFSCVALFQREMVICSHDILSSSRDSVLSALARHPFYQPEVSSESATTSIKGYTDGYRSGCEMVQRSDDITVDSTVAGKRRVKRPIAMDNDQKTDDSSTSQNLYTLKPMERVSFSGKQIPQRPSAASQNLSDDNEERSKFRKVSSANLLDFSLLCFSCSIVIGTETNRFFFFFFFTCELLM